MNCSPAVSFQISENPRPTSSWRYPVSEFETAWGSSSMRNRKGQGAASRGPGPRVLYESVAECVAGESEG